MSNGVEKFLEWRFNFKLNIPLTRKEVEKITHLKSKLTLNKYLQTGNGLLRVPLATPG